MTTTDNPIQVDDSSNHDQFESDATFPASSVAEALRSCSYKNTAHALAELVDNSYDASATTIHIALICKARNATPYVIAVLDNASGMDKNTLRHCLQHGHHMEVKTSNGRGRIGKFGVGLLSASFHQCKHVEVYSWDNGKPEEVYSTGMHVDNCPDTLPIPVAKKLPAFFDSAFATFTPEETNIDQSGTLVVWNEVDRLSWRKASTLADHLSQQLGRVYRNFLAKKELKIKITTFSEDESGSLMEATEPLHVKPVDPLFLHHWNCSQLNSLQDHIRIIKNNPTKYGLSESDIYNLADPVTLFEAYDINNPYDNAKNEDGTFKESSYVVKDNKGNIIGSYRIMASYRRNKIVRAAAEAGGGKNRNPGDEPYGKLAERLRGVSILRGGREILLDTNWLRADLTIDRWVALSFDFDPSLDTHFGIGNDKQRISVLSDLAQVNIRDISADEYDGVVLQAARHIQETISKLRRIVGRDKPRKQSPDFHRPDYPEVDSQEKLRKLSEKTKKIADKGKSIDGIDNIQPSEAYYETLTKIYDDTEHDGKPAATTRPKAVILDKLSVDFVADNFSGGANIFVPVNSGCGMLLIKLNAQHPIYKMLYELLSKQNEDESDDNTVTVLKDRLDNAVSILRGLFYAFGRAELDAGYHQSDYEQIRLSWGVVTKDLFDEE